MWGLRIPATKVESDVHERLAHTGDLLLQTSPLPTPYPGLQIWGLGEGTKPL